MIPLFSSAKLGIVLLLGAILFQNVVGAVGGPAWSSIVRDIVPQDRMGAFFARRQKLTVALSIPLSLGAGWFVTWWANANPTRELHGYSLLFFLGFLVGLYTLHRLTLVVEGDHVERSVVVQNLMAEIRRPMVSFTTVDGAVDFLDFPLNALSRTRRHLYGRLDGMRSRG